jgi:hypothetical protein
MTISRSKSGSKNSLPHLFTVVATKCGDDRGVLQSSVAKPTRNPTLASMMPSDSGGFSHLK